MGEGAGAVILEEREHALARGAPILAEIIGYGLSGDAFHITSPAEDGDGAYRSMAAALKRADIAAADLDYINAHGTSTPLGDEIELRAVERLLGNAGATVSMSSTKSATGHLLGAAGAIEAIFSILAIRDGIAPPTINLDNPSVETAIDLVPHVAKRRKIDVALSNRSASEGPTRRSSSVDIHRDKKRLRAQALRAEFRHIDCLSTGHANTASRPRMGSRNEDA